ncbi:MULTISPECIES: FAD binding domain-containing protein [Aminobacterium]|uniref:FAD binding domain-containing protein n=1 Tax=Aminobacterium TaxID=81466 RepID=UPI002580FD16|nr:FAD binding domain-containing protein [Aminobacterium sp. UBA4987]
MKWFYPATLEEASHLLSQEGHVIHGAGTGLLRRGLKGIDALIDITSLPLDYFKKEDNTVIIGAGCTYAQISESLMQIDPDNALGKALANAASTPLRNRITIGGSLGFLPPWSDLLGPLIALDARLGLAWPLKQTMSVPDFLANPLLQKKCLITHVILPLVKAWTFYHRETRVSFDYPSLTLTILLKISEGTIEKSRVIFTGNKTRFYKAKEVESHLEGRKLIEVIPERLSDMLQEIDFLDKQAGSAEYLNEISKVWLERGLLSLKGGE